MLKVLKKVDIKILYVHIIYKLACEMEYINFKNENKMLPLQVYLRYYHKIDFCYKKITAHYVV